MHPIYAGGPKCNPHCPGEYSSYHEGYSDGYQACHRVVLDDVISAVNRIRVSEDEIARHADRGYEAKGFGRAMNQVITVIDAMGTR